MPPRENWHLDKRVPISIITAIVAQTIVFVYVGASWKASVEGRIANLERSDKAVESHENRLVILEQQFSYIRADLSEIKTLLRRRVPSELENVQ